MQWIKLAHLTLFELWQNRTFKTLLTVALLTPLLAVGLSSLFLYDIGKVYVDVVAAMAQLLAVVFFIFLVVTLLSRDIFDRIVYVFLTPPMSRRDYYIGRFLGIVAVFVLLLLVLLLSSVLGAWLYLDGLSDMYQSGYKWNYLGQLVFFNFFQYISILGFIFFVVSWSSGNAETMLFTLAMLIFSWIFPPVLAALQSPDVMKDTPEFVVYFLQWIYDVIPHLRGADITLSIAHGGSIGYQDTFLYVAEHILYSVIFFALGLAVFKRRDL